MAGLQTQIVALQQQVADLAHLFTQQVSVSTDSTDKPLPKPSKSSLKPTPARPTLKKPAKPAHVIPRVEYGDQGNYVVICPRHGVLPFEPDTDAWFAWVKSRNCFDLWGKRDTSPLTIGGVCLMGPGGRIARSATGRTLCVWHPTRSSPSPSWSTLLRNSKQTSPNHTGHFSLLLSF